METLKKIKKEYLFIFLILLIPLVSSSNCPNGIYPCDNTIPFVVSIPTTPSSVNYSLVNVNNSNYLDSLDSTEFCRMNYDNNGNIRTINGNNFSSYGDSGGLTYMTHFFAGNGTQNFSIISGVNAVGTGFKWGTGSRLIATTSRMIYTPDNDWIDILNELGNKYMATIRLAGNYFYSNSALRGVFNDTGLWVNGSITATGNAYLLGGTIYTNIINAETYTKAGYFAPYDGKWVKFRVINDSFGYNFQNSSGYSFVNISTQGVIDTLANFSVNHFQGITKEIKIVENVDLLGMTETYCNQTITGGIITNTTCGNSEIVNMSFPFSMCSGTDKVIGINSNGSINCSTDQTGAGGVNPLNITCSGNDKISAYSNITGVFTCSTDQTSLGGGDGTGSWINSTTNTTTYVDVIGNNSIYANNYRWMYPKGKSPLVESTFDDMNYLVTAYNRITTAPTINNADANIISSLNFISAATTYGDGGLVMTGDTATNTYLFNLSYLDYFAVRLKLAIINNSNRTDMIGAFGTATTVNMKTAFTGIFFYKNSSNMSIVNITNTNNWTAQICQSGSCNRLNTTINDTNYHIFEIEGNNRMPVGNSSEWTFYIDGINFGTLAMNNLSQRISTIGTWVETTDTTADTQRIDWSYYEIQRYF